MKYLFSIVLFFIVFFGFSQDPNDECSSAIELTLQSLDNINYTVGNLGNATESTPACSGTTSTDIWYKFTATTKANKIYLPPKSGLDLAFELYDSCGGNSITCVDSNSTSVSENYYDYHFTIGQTYYIKVFLYNQSFSNAEFNIAVVNMSQSNDECSESITIPIQNESGSLTFTEGNLGGATESLTACTGDTATDIWYKFTATNSSLKIYLNPESYYDAVFEVFDACDGNSIVCMDNNGSSFSEAFEYDNYIVDNEYFIRVYGNNQFFENLVINLRVTYDDTTSIDSNINNLSKLVFYPNPASKKIFIDNLNVSKMHARINSLNGTTLKSTLLIGDYLDVSDLKSGMYFITLINDETNYRITKKIIIK